MNTYEHCSKARASSRAIMGRSTAKADGKQKSVQAATTEAKRQLEAALGFSKAVNWKLIAQQHGVGVTTTRAHVVGHAGSAPRA